MNSITDAVIQILDDSPIRLVISKPASKGQAYKRIAIDNKGNYYQISKYTDKQVFHENLPDSELLPKCVNYLEQDYRQLHAWSKGREYSISISKKKKVLFSAKAIKAPCQLPWDPAHNRVKHYILPEGTAIPPLMDMGIFTAEGKVVKSMYDKYRQVNRFIELVDDVIKKQDYTHLNIIDFGCGKSYLTFILYYYLTQIRRLTVNMVGLDLKEDVIKKCNAAAEKYHYTNLKFELGDINGFHCPFDVDMVITLHACDTATDYALYNAVSWRAKMIFSVPCCQHELNQQISTDTFSLFTRYGIVSERFSALMTDAIRANLLEYSGYNTQLLEFIDFEHTPKNILIRAFHNPGKSGAARQKALDEVERVISEYHVNPTLYRLLCGSPSDNANMGI